MRRLLHIVCVVALIGGVFSTGVFVGSQTPVVSAQGGTPSSLERTFAPFWEAWNLIKRTFVRADQLDDTKMMEGALRGLVQSLGDDRSAYLDPVAFEQQTSRLQSEYEGIGASVRKDEVTGGVRIVRTFEGSPARSVLREGDIILTVDGQDITSLSLTEAVSKIRGPSGSSVRLGILRRGERDVFEVVVRRARIKQEIITVALFEGNIGYIGLSQFTDTSAEDVSNALAQLDANNLNGLILDMRNDPGGPLSSALNVASLFLRDGTIILERGRRSRTEIRYDSNAAQLEAQGYTLAPDVPMVVILNQASASASELVAGALQDRGRAKVVGTVSFGKGSIQTWNTLSNGGGLIITIANFFKPSGGVIDGIGIIPDVFVPWTEEQQEARPNYDPQLSEAIWLLRGRF
ncbi:MAG: peptidase S41 [Candidatus Thermofonsia Clade 1 bacterium]|uniref:Peptidase S41 n=2 Tax=Candidatus Thermofonsia Clade 1 bacterium TaxID=2364210 RepID=A0A2M8NYS5_9CHLR|nr:MAG: peptidase S41 [Candidatus Thermofonsia Clade 1 bacterium]